MSVISAAPIAARRDQRGAAFVDVLVIGVLFAITVAVLAFAIAQSHRCEP